MSYYNRYNAKLTSATVGDLREVVGFPKSKSLSYVGQFDCLKVDKNNPEIQPSIKKKWLESTNDNVRLEAGFYQLQLRGDDGETLTGPNGEYLEAPICKVDERGKVTKSSKEEYVQSNPDILQTTLKVFTPEPKQQAAPGGPTPFAKNVSAAVAAQAKDKPASTPAKTEKDKDKILI
ncbi:hypothetical protein SAMN05444156_2155 [Verrucomicrobium sp. GAS474]|uniref:hypothetical protein n=1 Tax=Verrucomicrobium sp. GAS474 TaxID=1882831 RepID=UPI000879EFF3|nr:hypothetical protein [Verrucomicrobium sp. GAS474]SDU13318.1 hypothetical protein SAMN05444156_2155 [Verrucomicrobium sp. GAS474]